MVFLEGEPVSELHSLRLVSYEGDEAPQVVLAVVARLCRIGRLQQRELRLR